MKTNDYLYIKKQDPMLTWKDVISFSVNGNPKPDRIIAKSETEWQQQLTTEQYQITRLKGTERPHSGDFCTAFDEGQYNCVCCNTPLFDSTIKFESGTGWPSFTQPIKENAIQYKRDDSHGMIRVEILCNTCEAHLGHVFPDGPEPSGLRYCVNSLSLVKLDNDAPARFQEPSRSLEQIVIGGGCFWCTESVFRAVKGIVAVESGYSGGNAPGYPTYKEVCSGLTGHAEVIKLTYNPDEISLEDILLIFMATHNPTTLNRQGADVGTQYRSVIFYDNEAEKQTAEAVIKELTPHYSDAIVTEVSPLINYFKAEEYHQDYYTKNPDQAYCNASIPPKLDKLKKLFAEKMK